MAIRSAGGSSFTGGTVSSITATGAVSGASVSATGAVSGASVSATGAVSGATVVATTSTTSPFYKVSGGTSPTIQNIVGLGATGAVAVGGVDGGGAITLRPAGAGIAANGSCDIVFSNGVAGISGVLVSVMDNTGTWDGRATIKVGAVSATQFTMYWDNNAVALSAADYNISYLCVAQ